MKALKKPSKRALQKPVNSSGLSQSVIHQMQEAMLKMETRFDPVEEHYFADGVYGRVMKVPAGTTIVGKAHKTRHFSIMLKGKADITQDDGSVVTVTAPMVSVTPAGKKKIAYVHEEMWFMNIHPTDTEDLDEIEAQVIIPDTEHLLQVNQAELLEGVK